MCEKECIVCAMYVHAYLQHLQGKIPAEMPCVAEVDRAVVYV